MSQTLPETDTYLNSASLGNVQSQPIDWLWPHRIPIGKITLLAGDPGLGKSMLSLDIAARLSRGLPFPDAPVPSPLTNHQSPIAIEKSASTILLSAEDCPSDTIRPRLEAAGADLSHILMSHPSDKPTGFSPFSLLERDNIDLLQFDIECADNCRLLIIDPIHAYLGNTNVARNDAVRKALLPLAALAASHGIAILAITHLRKTTSARAIYRSMDSLAFAAASRSVWYLTSDPADHTRRIFSSAKSNLAHQTPALSFRIADNHILWEPPALTADLLTADHALAKPADPNHAIDRAQAKAWLLEILSQSPLPFDDIQDQARKLGISYATLRRAKSELNITADRAGFGPLGSWLWRLPDNSPHPP